MIDSKKKNDIKGWIFAIMELTNYQLDLIEHSKGINMSYNFIYNRLGVDVERVQYAVKELEILVPLKTYVEVMTLHELGHAADREALLDSLPETIEIYNLKKEADPDSYHNDPVFLKTILDEQLMNIEFEKTAWLHAEVMNRRYEIADEKTFDSIRQHNLASYKIPYLQNVKIYEHLLASSAELTA